VRRTGLSTVVVIVATCFPGVLLAQFTDPRNYSNSPVGLNQLELDYGVAHANSSIDPSIVVGTADLKLNEGGWGLAADATIALGAASRQRLQPFLTASKPSKSRDALAPASVSIRWGCPFSTLYFATVPREAKNSASRFISSCQRYSSFSPT
jgi:hypothetical protein